MYRSVASLSGVWMRTTLLASVCSLVLSACQADRYEYVGQVGFRRSYSGQAYWSDAQVDSVERSNPINTTPITDEEEPLFLLLEKQGIANKRELFLSKIETLLKDTLVVDKEFVSDTIRVVYDSVTFRPALQVKNAHNMYRIPIDAEPLDHVYSLLTVKEGVDSWIVLLNKNYFMNGFNFDLLLFKKD